MQEPADILVVGAGPAGCMAAIFAARTGARVCLFERLGRPGTKLTTTGGGRCNLTNTLPTMDFLAAFGRQARFMRTALDGMGPSQLVDFFRELGLSTHSRDGLHVFPCSESALTVRDALVSACLGLGVQLRLGTGVSTLLHDGAALGGINTVNGPVHAKSVILTAGGCAWPKLGSNGSGFELAGQAGHTIIPPVPALVPLVTRQSWPRRCAGVTLSSARISLNLPKTPRIEVVGDLLFTHRGISGPAALNLSGRIARHIMETGTPVCIRLHLTSETRPDAWLPILSRWRQEHPRKLVRGLVAQHLPASLAEEVCRETGVSDQLRAAELPRTVQRSLAEWLSGIPLDIVETEGFGRAMVTSGGVSVREVDPKTLESKLVRGLYFAGELLDIDGPCGGYNLQWAFSSGRLAGMSAASSLYPAS